MKTAYYVLAAVTLFLMLAALIGAIRDFVFSLLGVR